MDGSIHEDWDPDTGLAAADVRQKVLVPVRRGVGCRSVEKSPLTVLDRVRWSPTSRSPRHDTAAVPLTDTGQPVRPGRRRAAWTWRFSVAADDVIVTWSAGARDTGDHGRCTVVVQLPTDEHFRSCKKHGVAITGRNTTGPPCSVGHPTPRVPGGRPARPPAVLQTTTDDNDRRQTV